jgi:threonine dehydrogenase-like Zn-dependent dehydrogenase
MEAITAVPMKAGSLRVEEVDDVAVRMGGEDLLVEGMAMGVCGTDREIVAGRYGWAPAGRERLTIGHESLGHVLQAPLGSGFTPGDLVVGVVRRPCPEMCLHCAAGEWDMCTTGHYTERGIKARDGYGARRYTLEADFAVKLDPSLSSVGVLLEPTSVVAKAWDHIERIGRRSKWEPRTVLVTGAGPIGLLAAMLGVQKGLEVHVFDRATDGPKPALVRALGAEYHAGAVQDAGPDPDVVLEATGAASVVFTAMQRLARGAIMCLTGVSSGTRTIAIEGAMINRQLVLENSVVFGSVNANTRHYQAAAEALRRADRTWLENVISRRVPLGLAREAFERHPNDVKVIIDLTQ